MDSALALYRRANALDEQYLPAQLSRMILLRKSGRALELRHSYPLTSSSRPFAACLNAIAWGISSHDVPEAQAAYSDLLRTQGRNPCTEVARTTMNAGYDLRSPLLLEALRQYGYAPRIMWELGGPMRAEGAAASLLSLSRAQIAAASTPAMKLTYELWLVSELQTAGDRQAGRREAEKIISEFSGDARPYVRWRLLELKRSLLERASVTFVQSWKTINAAMRAIARRNHADAFEFDPLLISSIEDVDRGDLASAIGTLDQAIAIATRTRSPDLQMLAYLYRGRALAAQGKQERAIADLQRSANAARLLGERYRLAEAYHQMAHAYEARASWEQAISAVDSFVSIGATVRDKSMRMMRLNDAAAIQWKAGYHARANQYSQEMIRTIDADSANYEYAGIYFERIGDLARARDYYRKTYDAEVLRGSPKLALAGLTRVYEQLGFMDSAIVAATMHDALPSDSEREVLLPRILARQGRMAEAVSLADKWTRIQRERGNPAATAAAINQEAEIALVDHPRRALALADSASYIARSVASFSQMVSSRRLRGLALTALGDVRGGRRELVTALSLARTVQDVFLPVTLSTDLADLARRSGDAPNALNWYARANTASRAATINVYDPVLIARVRNARKEIFDGALRAVLLLPETERTTKLLEWSRIKKGGGTAGTEQSHPFATGRPEAAVFDYLTVGDTLLLTVYTTRLTRTLILPLSAKTAAEMSRRLVAPLRDVRNGSIDLSRTIFSQEIAQHLFNGLIQPVASLLGGITEIAIVPDVPLQLVPFDALIVNRSPGVSGDYSRIEFAGARWNITYAPTYGIARRQVERSFAGGKMLYVSHASPAIDRERAAIESAWPTLRLNEIVGTDATEGAVRRAPRVRIIHFATHAISDDVDPLRSHLVLQPGHGDDGLLHAREIRQLHWTRSLVFLSACETAVGPMFAGTGTLSLGRAFFDAGAAMVIATQWPIGGISADIARDFYTALSRGMSVSNALYAAKRNVRSNPKTSHPFFWASHVLITGAN